MGVVYTIYTYMEFNHYIYVYLDPLKPGNFDYTRIRFDHEPFYIGYGKNNRINDHINESKYSDYKTIKHNKILKILKNSKEPIRYKLYENLTEYSAQRLEMYFIDLIGRRDQHRGHLTNLTDGGGKTNTDKYIQEIINSYIKNTIGNNRKGKLNANYGKKWSDEQKREASIRQKNNHKHLNGNNNPSKRKEVRDKISETKMGLKNPNANLWELVSPKGDKIRVEGGIKRKLKEYELTYMKMKWKEKNGIFYSKCGWKMYKLLDN